MARFRNIDNGNTTMTPIERGIIGVLATHGNLSIVSLIEQLRQDGEDTEKLDREDIYAALDSLLERGDVTSFEDEDTGLQMFRVSAMHLFSAR